MFWVIVMMPVKLFETFGNLFYNTYQNQVVFLNYKSIQKYAEMLHKVISTCEHKI